MRSIRFIIIYLLVTLTLLVLPIASSADFKQIYEKYDSTSIFTPSSTFNPNLALLSVVASDEVYLSDGHSAALENAGFTGFIFTATSNDTQAITGVKKFNNEGKRVIAIIFRGTSNLADAMSDANIVAVPFYSSTSGMVHKGFFESTDSFIKNESLITVDGNETLDAIISEKNPNDIFWIAGHSLGGAVATLYAARLKDRGVKPANIITYTFGAPAVGDSVFVSHYNDIDIHRIRNLYDPIPDSTYLATNFNPLLPTYNQIGYQRVYNNNIYIANPITPALSDLNLSEHSLSVYKSDVGWILNNSLSTATPSPYPIVVSDSLTSNGQNNYYSFTVITPGRYVIYTRGGTTTEAALYNANYSTILSVIRLNGEQNNFRMDVVLTAGTYYLGIKGLYPNPVGNYRLHIDGPGEGTQMDRDDHGLSAWNATAVAVGSVTNGGLDVPGDEDFFKFTVTNPGKYVIYTRGPTTTEAALYDVNYATLLSVIRLNGEQNNFRMEVVLTAGTYYLEIKGLYPNPTGNYRLHIDGPGEGTQSDSDDHGLSAWNATPVSVNSVTNGILDVPGDEDFFAFTIMAPGNYVIYATGPTTTEAALYDTNYNTLLSVIRLNGEQNNFRIEEALTAGNYYLEIKGLYPNPTGNYLLYVNGPGLQQLSMNGPVSVSASNTASYSAIASWDNNTTATVTPIWSVTPTTYASISSGGKLTTLAVPRDQTVTITCIFTAYGVTKTATKLVTINKDTSVPIITTFTLPATSGSLTVPVTCTATDNVSVTGYLLTEASAAPTVSTTGWSGTAPTSYSFSTSGSKTLYAWAKDAAGNVSQSKLASVVLTLPVQKVGDCDNDGIVTIAEVQSAINMFLGMKTVASCVDLDNSATVSIAEVQKVINAFLGL